MVASFGRNEPCWCGSGKKFKRCHLDRDKQAPLTDNERNEIIKKIRNSSSNCLFPLSETDSCSKRASNCHTISRQGSLSTLAKNGHIYRFREDYFSLCRLKGEIEVERVGIREVLSFPLFCNLHDKETFSPIEDHPFVPNQHNTFLLAYRAVCQELCTRTRVLEIGEELSRQLDRGKTEQEQHNIQHYVNQLIVPTKTLLEGVRTLKKHCDSVLLRKDYSAMKFCTFKLDIIPDVMCSLVVNPYYDFYGAHIQQVDGTGRLNPPLTISMFSSNGVSWIVFAYLGSAESSKQFISSFIALPEAQKPHAIIRFIFSGFENICFSPKWWDSLTNDEREKLKKRFWDPQGSPNPYPKPSYFNDDGLRVVKWTITETVSN